MSEPVDNDASEQPENTGPAPEDMPIAETQGKPKPEPDPVLEKNDPATWVDTAPKGKKKQANPILVGIAVLAALGLAALVIKVIIPSLAPKPSQIQTPLAAAPVAAGPLAPYAKGSMAHLVTLAEPKVIDSIAFLDRDKKAVNLSDFKGQVVVLNVWATWCAPCRFEMPTLAHLQKMYAGKAVKVLPLSVDTDDKFDDVKSFIDVQEPLDVYADPNFQAPSKYGISGMPATLILDKQGREVARLDGEAVWDTPEVQALLDKLLAE